MTQTWRTRPAEAPEPGSEISSDDRTTCRQPTCPGRRWDSYDVATLVELAMSLAFHRARVAPVEALQHEVQPFGIRVRRLARALESAGGRRG